MFLQKEVSHLTLHFPAKFQNNHNPQFIDNGVKDWTKNPGRTANIYHRKFSAKIKDDSLQQIQSAILDGATYKEHKGFHNRNSKVAESRYLIAFTWGDTDIPKKGGTRNTWDKCQGRKIHIPLSSLMIQSTPVTPIRMKKKTTPGKEPSKPETSIQTNTYKSTEVFIKTSQTPQRRKLTSDLRTPKSTKKSSPATSEQLKKHCSLIVSLPFPVMKLDTTDQPRISKRKGEVTCDTQFKQLKLEDEHVTDLSQRKRSFPDCDIIEESPPTKKTDSTSIILNYTDVQSTSSLPYMEAKRNLSSILSKVKEDSVLVNNFTCSLSETSSDELSFKETTESINMLSSPLIMVQTNEQQLPLCEGMTGLTTFTKHELSQTNTHTMLVQSSPYDEAISSITSINQTTSISDCTSRFRKDTARNSPEQCVARKSYKRQSERIKPKKNAKKQKATKFQPLLYKN